MGPVFPPCWGKKNQSWLYGRPNHLLTMDEWSGAGNISLGHCLIPSCIEMRSKTSTCISCHWFCSLVASQFGHIKHHIAKILDIMRSWHRRPTFPSVLTHGEAVSECHLSVACSPSTAAGWLRFLTSHSSILWPPGKKKLLPVVDRVLGWIFERWMALSG